MTNVVVESAVIMALLFTVAMFVTVAVLSLKGWKVNPIGVRLLIIFMWAYMLSIAALYGTRMLTGGYSTEDAIMYSVLFPLAVISFWILSLRLYRQNLKQPADIRLRKV